MAEPVFSQAEIDALLAVEKVAPYESQFYAVLDTRFPGVKPYQIDVRAAAPFEGVILKVRIVSNLRARAFSTSLYAQFPGRSTEGVCRYDVHPTAHPNKPRCDWIGTIPRGGFHIHRYGETAVRVGYDWDDCARPLEVDDGPFESRVRWMVGRFIDDVRIRFDDHSKYESLFGMTRP